MATKEQLDELMVKLREKGCDGDEALAVLMLMGLIRMKTVYTIVETGEVWR